MGAPTLPIYFGRRLQDFRNLHTSVGVGNSCIQQHFRGVNLLDIVLHWAENLR